jgi:hypothetical protein
MRAPATLLKAGLSTAAAVVLLTACGGSGDDAADAAASAAPASSSAPTSSSAPSSGAASSSAAATDAGSSGGSDDPEVKAFCSQAEQVLTQVSTSLDTSDPAAVGPALDKAVEDLSAVQAPADISADWETAKTLFTGLRDAVNGADLSTPEGQASVQQEAARLQGETGDAQTRLDAWTKDNCGA